MPPPHVGSSLSPTAPMPQPPTAPTAPMPPPLPPPPPPCPHRPHVLRAPTAPTAPPVPMPPPPSAPTAPMPPPPPPTCPHRPHHLRAPTAPMPLLPPTPLTFSTVTGAPTAPMPPTCPTPLPFSTVTGEPPYPLPLSTITGESPYPLPTTLPFSTITGESPYPLPTLLPLSTIIDESRGDGVHLGDGVELGDGVGDGDKDDLDTITPKIGMEFATQKDAYNFYNGYALKMGFGTRWSSTSRSRSDPSLVISRLIVCSKEGKRRTLKKPIMDEEVDHRREIRVDCKAMIKIYLTKSGRWRVGKFVAEHNNHNLSTPSKALKHRSHKKVHRQPVVKNLITQLHSEGISNASIARVVNSFEPDPQHLITPQQVHDHLRIERKNNLGKNCAKIVKHFIEKKVEDPTFYSSIELDDDYTLRSVFWADRRSQESYQKFSDVIIFDVTYRTNNLCLPFAPFTGINHHRQSTLFGCALLADETEQTFVWLFEQWLRCMGGKAPGAIITDQDAAIGNAIARVFPNTVHRYCDWHLDKNVGEHMVHLKTIHGPEFELHFNRLRSSSSICEAEDCWKEMMATYKLREKSWLPKLWERRASWLPCYLNDKFLAGTRTSQRAESINAFFDTYVHAGTTLTEFVVQYDKALASRRKAEEDEDFKTMDSQPVLTLEWPLEKQAGRCYTRALFSIFKQEMKDAQIYWADKVHKEGTVTTYLVGRATKERSKWRTVLYDSDGVVVSCACRHFESVGLLCRHVLCILWKKHVSEIPDRYILRRWTIESRHRFGDVGMGATVRNSEVDRNLHWDIRYKCNKALEVAYKVPNFAVEFDRFLTSKLAEYDNLRSPEGADVSSQGLNHQVDPIAPLLSQNSSSLIPEINIRDPMTSLRHKGRPRLASRLPSGLELSQEEATKKKKTCGFCGEKGHYRTGCSKAKASNGQSDSGGSQALPS